MMPNFGLLPIDVGKFQDEQINLFESRMVIAIWAFINKKKVNLKINRQQ